MLDHMLATPNWSLRPWKATLETQLSSWKMYIPGVGKYRIKIHYIVLVIITILLGSAPEMVEIKNFKTLLDTLKEEELDNPELINGPGNCQKLYIFTILIFIISERKNSKIIR